MQKIPGIYSITSKTNLKVYIGSSNSVHHRWRQHLKDLRGGRHGNPHLQHHVNKWGLDDLEFEVMEVEPDPSLRLGLEQLMITSLYGEGCFNIVKDASCPGLGRSPSAETREKIAASLRGRPLSDDHKSKVSAAMSGVKKSPEHAAKVGARHKGKVIPQHLRDEHSARMSGRVHSPETRAKMSLSQKAKALASPETRAKRSAAATGRKMTPEAIAKRQASRYGVSPPLTVFRLSPHAW